MHPTSTDGLGPIDEEIVRSAGQPADLGGNDRGTSLAWAAGFFDGEGYIGIVPARRSRKNPRGHSYTLTLSIGQVGRYPLDVFHSIVGHNGTVHVYEKKQANRSSIALWRAASQTALSVLELLLPHLVWKKDQALVGIAFQKDKTLHRSGAPLTPEQQAEEVMASERLKELRAQIKGWR